MSIPCGRGICAAILIWACAAGGRVLAEDCNNNGVDDRIDVKAVLDFGIPRSMITGAAVRNFGTGDLNNDGVADILTVSSPNLLTVSLSKADGTYDLPTQYTVGSSPIGVAAGDWDGDTDLDVVVANRSDKSMTLLRNLGDGTLQSYGTIQNLVDSGTMADVIALNIDNDSDTDFAVLFDDRMRIYDNLDGTGNNFDFGELFVPSGSSAYMTDIQAGLLNNDAFVDLVLVDRDEGDIYILLNDGDGTFTESGSFYAGNRPSQAALAKLDNNDSIDIVYTEAGFDRVRIRLNDGNGVFSAAGVADTGPGPYAIVAAPFDADADIDVAVQNTEDDTISLLLNNGDGTFADGGTLEMGLSPAGLAATDFDLDNDADLVAATFTRTLNLFPNDGTGRFSVPPPATEIDATSAFALTAVDLDHDSDLDLITSPYFAEDVIVVLLNDGGVFVPQTPIAAGSNPTQIATGLLNADAHIDVACANAGGGTVTLLFGNGDGTFGSSATLAVGDECTGVAICNIDRDADMDVVATHTDSPQGTLYVFLNDGTGQFPNSTLYPTGDTPGFVNVNDFNGDGAPDVAIANRNTSDIAVYLNQNTGTGALNTPTSYGFGSGPFGITSAMINDDAYPDLVATYVFTAGVVDTSLGVLMNNGNGTFAAPVYYVIGGQTLHVTTGDLDGDGDNDILCPQYFSGDFSVLQNLGDGTFAPYEAWLLGTGNAGEAIIADLTGDSRPEVAIALDVDLTVSSSTGAVVFPTFEIGESVEPDCNENGVPDACDISGGASLDDNGNGIPDECEGLGDLNCDGVLDLFDIEPFALALSNPAGYAIAHPGCDITRADANQDGVVDLFDIDPFVILLTGR